jgi:hypothetical protein
MKYAFDMARHKYIDQDPVLGPISRGQRESLDERGQPTTRPAEAGAIGNDTDSLIRAALNSYALQLNPGRRGLGERLSNVANRGAVQTGSHVIDTIFMLPNTAADAGIKNTFKGVIEGLTKYNDLKARGLVRDTGNLRNDIVHLGEAWRSKNVLDLAAEVLTASGRVTGPDALNKLMQATSAAAGVMKAREAMAANDSAFFRKIGLPDWASMPASQVEEFVGRWVTEGSQGSGGAKDTPMFMLRSGGVGRTMFPILRWAFNMTNQQIDRAYKPLFDKSLPAIDRVMPLATRLVGGALAKEAATQLVGVLFGREDRTPSYKEWDAAGKPNKLKYVVQRLTDLQMLPAMMTFVNFAAGNTDLPRNLGTEALPNVIEQLGTMAATRRDFTLDDAAKALDATLDQLLSNWRDVSKMAADETRDPLEQARARYDQMQRMTRFGAKANPLNLGTQLEKAKTEEDAVAIARKIVDTATIDTPEIAIAGPSDDVAYLAWLGKTDPALRDEYVRRNAAMASGEDKLYALKKDMQDAVNELLKQKKQMLMSENPDDIRNAKALKFDWKRGELKMR